MSQRSVSCLWTLVPQVSPAPCNRYKHACCAYRGNVYLHGGRERCARKDFWKYNVVCNTWIELDSGHDEAPEELEEHTMVAYKGFLYVFGGLRDSAYSNSKIPLWLFDTVKEQWIQLQNKCSPSQNLVPANRKGHSAVVMGSSMYIYGGYIDLRGPSEEFWKFDLVHREWSQLNNAKEGPGPRHSHAAMAHKDCMYIHGGLQGLREQNDLWKWNSSSQTWSRLRAKDSAPSKLMGHSAAVYKDSMLVFGGGETQCAPKNCLWRLSLTTTEWEKLPSLPGSIAPCRVHHCSVGLGCSFQSSVPRSAKDTSISDITKRRPFKNKCFPYCSSKWQTRDEIELQPLPKYLTDINSALNGVKPQRNCLTFENQDVVRDKCDCEQTVEETEDNKDPPMPDLLLILGGKPIKEQAPISVLQMTLADR